jgi:hypothetical protein
MGKHVAEWMFWAVSLIVSLGMLSTLSSAQGLGEWRRKCADLAE